MAIDNFFDRLLMETGSLKTVEMGLGSHGPNVIL